MEALHLTTRSEADQKIIRDISERFNGNILLPGEDKYEQSRKIWNGMIDKHPDIIFQCKNKEDVIAAVNFAKTKNLPISIKSGGHNVSGNAVSEGGVMLDLSQMKEIWVDAEKRLAIAEAGVTWAEFDRETQLFKLATTGGIISSTGIAGLTLGGGVGWLVRKHGLTCDNLLEAEIVTADGKILKANINENQELFWGIRGGGGNFGVVTQLTYQLHEVDGVLAGMVLHTMDKAKEVIQFYREFVKTAPDEITLYCMLITSPDGLPMIALMGCYSGDITVGQEVMRPIREFGSPVADLIQPMPYLQLQTTLDAAAPHGNRYFWKSTFLKQLPDEAIDIILSHAATITSPYSLILLEYYGGKSSVEPEGGTAYPHRQNEVDLVIGANWMNQQEDQKHIQWTRNFWDDMQEYSSHRVYVNTLGIEGEDRVREAYGDNYKRLSDLKAKYDPNNLFCNNQNIKPGGNKV